MDSLTSYRFHTLHKEHGREFATADLVGDVLWRFQNARRLEGVAQGLIADVAPFQLTLQQAFAVLWRRRHNTGHL